ncbi:MAG: hypothetical protein ACHQ51_05250 [Elusimicrobiota bacterium]
MKRIVPIAALLIASAFVSARADDAAYGSLVGMARSAARARTADAAEADAGGADDRMREALKDAVAQTPAPRAPVRAPTAPAPDAEEGRAPVSVPAAAPARRMWTRLYSTLMPSWRRLPVLQDEFAPSASTATVRAAPPAAVAAPEPLPDSAAVKAGERRGLAELLSASAAPSDPQ